MTLLELVETTGEIPKKFTTKSGVNMEYSTGTMASGEIMVMYWRIINGHKANLWAIHYGTTEEEAKIKMKEHLLSYGKNL